jgi:signal transduction histidine kinase
MSTGSPPPVRGSIDRAGRLISADPRLARLQEAAGSSIGATLAVPQLADIARLVTQLGISLSRPALAATDDSDLDLWVRAEPSDEGVQLAIESWVERPARARRWPAPQIFVAEPPAAIDFTTDAELRLTRLAPALAQLLGASAGDAIGLPLTALLELRPGADGGLPLLSALPARRSFVGQAAASRRNGSTVLLSGEPRLGPGGDFLGLNGRFEVQVAATPPADSSFDDLLREPLDVIVGQAERIADKAEGPLRSDYAAYATDIAGAARHLLDVLQAMSQERGGASAERIDLAALAQEAASLVQKQANEAAVTLELDGVTTLPAFGQPREVTQILVNLIGNAIRHSPAGKVVRITASNNGMADVTVADQGPGVAPNDAERIFGRFEQVAPQGVGAGLGLAISRRLARGMSGDISLESQAGEGARFTLSLPKGD